MEQNGSHTSHGEDSAVLEIAVCTAPSAAALKRAIVDGHHQEVRGEIHRLFVEQLMLPRDIVPALGNRIQWPQGLAEVGKERTIRYIAKAIVDETVYAKIVREREDGRKITQKLMDARDEWNEEQGNLLWKPDETEYFLELMKWKKMWRTPTRRNHDKIAVQLTLYSGIINRFTKKKCMDHYLYLKHRRKMKIPTYEEAVETFRPRIRPLSSAPVIEEPTSEIHPFGSAKVEERPRTFERRDGELLHSALARDVTAKLCVLGVGDLFGEAIAAAREERWGDVVGFLETPANNPSNSESWHPIQHEFFALALLCADYDAHRNLAAKHLELSQRSQSDGNQSIFNIMTLPPETAAILIDGAGDDGDRGHYRRSKTHHKYR